MGIAGTFCEEVATVDHYRRFNVVNDSLFKESFTGLVQVLVFGWLDKFISSRSTTLE